MIATKTFETTKNSEEKEGIGTTLSSASLAKQSSSPPIVNKYNSFFEKKENEDFLKRLIEFHRNRNINTPIVSLPTFNGRIIDLHKLYKLVTGWGGWESVCEKERWPDVCTKLDESLFGSCTNASHAIKLIYMRYLSVYEKVHLSAALVNANAMAAATTIETREAAAALRHPDAQTLQTLLDPLNLINSINATTAAAASCSNNQTPAALSLSNLYTRDSNGNYQQPQINYLRLIRDTETDDDILNSNLHNRRRFAYLLDSMPMTYNQMIHQQYYQQQSATVSKQTNGSFISSGTNPYEKLEISLECGLPNEIDFVFNTILLLSSEEYHTFRVYLSHRLIDLMLAHVGFFGLKDKYNLRYLYDNVWNSKTSNKTEELYGETTRNFIKFWHYSIQLPEDDEINIDNESDHDNDVDMMSDEDLNDSIISEEDETEDYENYFSDDEITTSEERFKFQNNRKLISDLLPQLYNKYLNTLPNQELLNLREMTNDNKYSRTTKQNGCFSVEIKRIEQVLVVMHNLSFEERNAEYMANQCNSLLEFLIMCLYCTGGHIELRKHALDILANLSRKIKLRKLDARHKCLLFTAITHLIVGKNNNTHSSNGKRGKKVKRKSNINNNVDDSSADTTASQDRFDIIRGLEILSKLCLQRIDFSRDLNDDYSNEHIIANYVMYEKNKNNSRCLFLEKILIRLEQLLSIQDVLVIRDTLECLYSLTQHNEIICNLCVDYQFQLQFTTCTTNKTKINLQTSSKIISILVNFLTVDMTHFGIQNMQQQSTTKQLNQQNSMNPIKIYKILPQNGELIGNHQQQQRLQMTNQQQNKPTQQISIQQQQVSLLQQTLTNQHTALAKTVTPQQIIVENSKANQEQQAKNVLCNWLRTCFQSDQHSELSKTQLYPYYQQIAKMNVWTVLPIPTFFEILNAIFSNLKYDEQTNKIQGLKLVLNVKQQMELKQKQILQQQQQPQYKQQLQQQIQQRQLQHQQQENNQQQQPPPIIAIKVIAENQQPTTLIPPSATAMVNPNVDTITTVKLTNQVPIPLVNTTNQINNEMTNNKHFQMKHHDVISSILTPPNPSPPSTSTTQNSNSIENNKDEIKAEVMNTSNEENQSGVNINNNEKLEGNVLIVKENGIQRTEITTVVKLNGISNEQSDEEEEEEDEEDEDEEYEDDDSIDGKTKKKIKRSLNGNNSDSSVNDEQVETFQKPATVTTIMESVEEEETKKSSKLDLINNKNKLNGFKEEKKQEENITIIKMNGYMNHKSENSTDLSDTSTSTIEELDDNLNEEKETIEIINKKRKLEEEEKNASSEKTKMAMTEEKSDDVNNEDIVKRIKASEKEETTKTEKDNSSSIPVEPPPPTTLTEEKAVNIEYTTNNTNTLISVSNSNQTPPISTNTTIPITSTTSNNTSTTTNNATNVGGDYVCEWNNCKMSFNTVKSIYNHVCKYHLLNKNELNSNTATTTIINENDKEGNLCFWSGCDQIRRQKWSLVNHIQERHCNENALKHAFLCRQRGIIPATNNTPSTMLNYSNNAALLAIQRNQRIKFEDFISPEEGPLTKSIRLMSALTLRNLARNSDKAKQSIKVYEPILTDIAFDLLESSNAISSCLWYLSN